MSKVKKLRSRKSIKVAITGGGTGGHVYPGIAVAKEIKRQLPSSEIRFIGTKTGLEAKIVPYEGFALETIEVQGFKGREVGHKLKALFLLPQAVYRSIKLLREFRPSVVFGTGGYVSVPVIYASYLLHIPTVILEPNRRPGLANRLLSKSVDKIAVCFQESAQLFSQKKVIFTGNPIRKEFFLVGKTPPPDKGKKINILIVGGSLGARSINYAMIEALDYLEKQRECLTFTHQTGNVDFEYVKAGYHNKRFRADVHQYIQDMPKMYVKSHLIICRAGAATVAELAASGRSAILIPYPHGDRHQEFNALALKEIGIAEIISQQHLSGKALAEVILDNLEHPEKFAQVWPNSGLLAKEDAPEQLVKVCFQLAMGRKVRKLRS
jgi:UDP-N-acetylglucosamine--N-acetylmuramyl-(pentapeptide) pyrophosphoryl-undecaprenol N-acetylglucosamine transferase